MVSDHQFSFVNIKKDLGFWNHPIKVSDGFQLVDSGTKKSAKNKYESDTKSSYSAKKSSPSSSNESKNVSSNKNGPSKKSNSPMCLFPPCQSAGRRHTFKECTFCTEEEREECFQVLNSWRAENDPAIQPVAKIPEPNTSRRIHSSCCRKMAQVGPVEIQDAWIIVLQKLVSRPTHCPSEWPSLTSMTIPQPLVVEMMEEFKELFRKK